MFALKLIDLEEAIDNLDSAFEAKLEAFHSLYGVDKDDFDYFANADTAVLILRPCRKVFLLTPL